MDMLMLRPNGVSVKGDRRRVPVIRSRSRKFGPILKERVLSIKQDVLITGAHSSGKTRWLAKLDEKSNEVWTKQETIFIRAMEPLQRWYEDPRVEAFAVSKGKTWMKLPRFAGSHCFHICTTIYDMCVYAHASNHCRIHSLMS